MIVFSKLGRMGRLGNQLFQYAAVRSLSIKRGYSLSLPDVVDNPPEEHGQKCLLGEFNLNPDNYYFDGRRSGRIDWRYAEPDWRKPDLNFFNIPDWTDIEGYFQSTWYFKDCEEQIKKELTPKVEHLLKAQNYVESLRDGPLVSLHIRRGDNTDAQHIRTPADWAYVKMYERGGPYDVYYQNAVKFFKEKFENVRFLVFTGGARKEENNQSDLEWCRERFNEDDFVVMESAPALDDFCCIMQCDHNILSPVSSFGWWAAYQNVNGKNAIRVAPRSYHPEEPDFLRPGFYPEDWRLL